MTKYINRHINQHITLILVLVSVALSVWLLRLALADVRVSCGYGDSVRNYGLVIIACWGITLAVWRGRIAEQQSRQEVFHAQFSQATQLLQSHDQSIKAAGIRILKRIFADGDYPYNADARAILIGFIPARQPGGDRHEDPGIQEN